jgi:hypothetical protein
MVTFSTFNLWQKIKKTKATETLKINKIGKPPMGRSLVKLQLTHLDPMDETFYLVLFITPPMISELCGV